MPIIMIIVMAIIMTLIVTIIMTIIITVIKTIKMAIIVLTHVKNDVDSSDSVGESAMAKATIVRVAVTTIILNTFNIMTK